MNRLLKYLILLLFILLIVSISSFFFGSSSFKEKDVQLEIDGPTQATVGDEVAYRVKYKNLTKIELYDLKFRFSYPSEAVVIKDGKIQANLTEEFEVDKLSPGQSNEREFKVFLVGDRGNIKEAKVELSFNAGNLRSRFEKISLLSTTIVNVPVALTLVSPPNAISGQAISYILDYRNESAEDISNLRFEFDYPEGFIPQSFSPSPDQRNNTWDVSSLKQGKGSRIIVSGVLGGSEGETKAVAVKLKRRIDNDYIDYEKAFSVTLISNPLLGVSLTVNNSSDYSAHLEESLDYTIRYSNNSNFNLAGLNLTVRFEGDMYDLSSLNTKGGFFDNSSKTILWNSSIIPGFVNLPPGGKGQIDFRIKLKNQFSSLVPGASRDRFVKAVVRISTPNVPSGIDANEIAVSSDIITKISSEPGLNQVVYFNDPDLGSRGPFPPKVGEETTYTVHWQLANPGNDISGSRIIATLPANAEWSGVVSTGSDQAEPIYNPNINQIIWNLGPLPYGIGMFTSKYEAVFQIKIKPVSSQVGKFIKLLTGVQFSGTDSFTKQSVIVNGSELNTNDLADRPGEGIVE